MTMEAKAPQDGRRLAAGGLTLALVLAISFGTLRSGGAGVEVPGGDKLHHLLGFAALMLPVASLYPRWTLPMLALAIGFGGAIEAVQPFVGRSREGADWASDAAGAVLGTALGLMLGRLLRPRPGSGEQGRASRG